jgi:hypothetical protein
MDFGQHPENIDLFVCPDFMTSTVLERLGQHGKMFKYFTTKTGQRKVNQSNSKKFIVFRLSIQPGKRSLNPNWFKYRGRWGNPKSKCHPLKKIGLHFCQWSDGPTGIPRKEAHFDCTV